MPGRVIAVKVAPGQHVARGEELLVVESMKMENAIRAPRDGTVKVGGRAGRATWWARAWSWWSWNDPARASPWSRSARATGCRTRHDALGVRRTGSPSASACSTPACAWSRPAPSCRRSGCRRWPGSDEVLRRLRRPRGRQAAGAGAEPQGLRGGAGRRRARDRRVHRGQRDLQPQEHQRHHRRVVRALRGVRARGAARGALGARLRLHRASAAPTKGRVDPARVVEVCARLHEAGCDEISVGDTIGVGVPSQVTDVIGRLAGRAAARARWRCTSTTRAAPRSPTCWPRCRRASPSWTRRRAASAAAPTRPGASGNLATEDLLYMLHGMGIETGVDLAAVVAGLALRRPEARPRRCPAATCRPVRPERRPRRRGGWTARPAGRRRRSGRGVGRVGQVRATPGGSGRAARPPARPLEPVVRPPRPR